MFPNRAESSDCLSGNVPSGWADSHSGGVRQMAVGVPIVGILKRQRLLGDQAMNHRAFCVSMRTRITRVCSTSRRQEGDSRGRADGETGCAWQAGVPATDQLRQPSESDTNHRDGDPSRRTSLTQTFRGLPNRWRSSTIDSRLALKSARNHSSHFSQNADSPRSGYRTKHDARASGQIVGKTTTRSRVVLVLETAFIDWREQASHCAWLRSNSASTSFAAAIVASMSASECAAETKFASNWLHGR